jgi:hypothetical protein
MIDYLWIPTIVTAITLIFASILDIKTRYVSFFIWIPMIGIGTITSFGFWYLQDNNSLVTAAQYLGAVFVIFALKYLDTHQFKLQGFGELSPIIISLGLAAIIPFVTTINIYLTTILIFCVVVFILGKFGLMGGADVWALCFIAIAIPASPVTGTFLFGLLPYLILFLALGIGIVFTIITWVAYRGAKKALIDFMYPFIVPITIAFFITLFV